MKRNRGDGGIDTRGKDRHRLRWRVGGKRYSKTFKGSIAAARRELRIAGAWINDCSRRWRRIVGRRRRRRRTVGDGAADNRTRSNATDDSGTDCAAVTARIGRRRRRYCGKAQRRSRSEAHKRLVHVISFVIGRAPIWHVDRRKSPKPPNSQTRRNSKATLWRKSGAENLHLRKSRRCRQANASTRSALPLLGQIQARTQA